MKNADTTTASTSTRTLRSCTCGCGAPTARTFAPGHDARLKSEIRAVVEGRAEIRVLAKSAIAYGSTWTALPEDLRSAFAAIATGLSRQRHLAARRGRLGL